jgi:ABC-type bacteriocin/lantibiotic exporter with double-glycine peptidase domain
MIQFCLLTLLALADPSANVPEWTKPGRCATNSLYVYLRILNRTVPYEEVARALPKGERTSLADLRAAAKEFGVSVDIRKVNSEDLRRLPTPFIAHLDALDQGGVGHFITIFIVERDGTIRYIDGSSGLEHACLLGDLTSTFSGFVLLPGTWVSRPFLIGGGLVLGLISGSVVFRKRT